jgi:hypothetical protein
LSLLNPSNPAFLCISSYAVHVPIHPVKHLLPKYRTKRNGTVRMPNMPQWSRMSILR